MTAAFWYTVPLVILLAIASMCLTIAIMQRRSIWQACRSMFQQKPEPPKPSNVFPIEAYRQHHRDMIRRELIVADAFRRYNDYEIEQQRPQVH